MVDVVLLIGGAFAILGIVPLGRGFCLLAKRVALPTLTLPPGVGEGRRPQSAQNLSPIDPPSTIRTRRISPAADRPASSLRTPRGHDCPVEVV